MTLESRKKRIAKYNELHCNEETSQYVIVCFYFIGEKLGLLL